MEPTNLQKAIAVASKASQEDQAGNYEEAIESYKHAVKYFLHVVKREPQGKEGNQKIRDKCKQYLDRVEELQDYLDKKEVEVLGQDALASREHLIGQELFDEKLKCRITS